jgi:hypothetical protein
MSRSDDVTLASLARGAFAACGGNPEAATEYILVQVINDRKLLRSIFLPIIKDAVGYQIIPQAASDYGNAIEPGGRISSAFFDTVLPNGVRLGDVTIAQMHEAAEHLAKMAKEMQQAQAEGSSIRSDE